MPLGAFKTALMGAAGGGAAAMTAFGGIITQWKGAASVITDSSAADNNGTTTGVRYSTAATKSGTYGLRSVDFGDPPRGYVRAPTMSTLGMTTAFTVSCWAKTDAHPATWTGLFGQASTSSWSDGFGMYVSGTNTIRGFVNVYTSDPVIASGITFTNWNHYVLTYDGSNLKLYINGSLEDTAANSGTIASNTIGIADLHVASDDYSFTWPGVSDEWGFWNEALTAAEITAIYNSGTPLSLSSDSGNYASSANLKAYYKFEDPKTYRVHTFRGDGKFVVSAGEADVDYLVIAGGGGGGGNIGGGGGAGGVLENTSGSVTVTAQTYPITVGVGGSGLSWTGGPNASSGGDSVALGLTADGGGRGGGEYQRSPSSQSASALDGGSGGGSWGSGGGQNNEVGGDGTAGQGNDGGDDGDGSHNSGGGGGKGSVGQDSSSTSYVAGNGGSGGSGLMGITATTRTYAAGGGGGVYGGSGWVVGTGGSSIGGSGGSGPSSGSRVEAKSAVPNTGSGGGGGGNYGGGFDSAHGSTGIVLIRYEVEAA